MQHTPAESDEGRALLHISKELNCKTKSDLKN